MKYLWAAYKMGSFGKTEDISQEEFDQYMADYLGVTDTTMVLIADTKNGKIPVGMFSGYIAGPVFFIGSLYWFKWASSRNKIESSIHALNELRKEVVVVMHNHMKDKRFYENISKHGIIRRVGQWFDIYEDSPAQVWQTRKR